MYFFQVEVKPYVLDDQLCDECQGARCGGKFAPFFCANVTCLQVKIPSLSFNGAMIPGTLGVVFVAWRPPQRTRCHDFVHTIYRQISKCIAQCCIAQHTQHCSTFPIMISMPSIADHCIAWNCSEFFLAFPALLIISSIAQHC